MEDRKYRAGKWYDVCQDVGKGVKDKGVKKANRRLC